MLSPHARQLLDALTEELPAPAMAWAAGYLTALAERGRTTTPATPEVPNEVAVGSRWSIVYGTHTGNAKKLAERIGAAAAANGVAYRVLSAEAYETRQLAQEQRLVLVFATHGDGDPPEAARGLLDFVHSRRAPKLPGARHAVLALGDASYPKFCAVGRALDERLQALGSQPLLERGELDVEFESAAQAWITRWLELAIADLATPGSEGAIPANPGRVLVAPAAAVADQVTVVPLLSSQRITARDADKEVLHLELDMTGSSLRYEPGDALELLVPNPPELVEAVLTRLDADASAAFPNDSQGRSVLSVLSEAKEISKLSAPLLKKLAEHDTHGALAEHLRAGGESAYATLLQNSSFPALLAQFEIRVPAAPILAALRPLTGRAYSIASAQDEVGDEAHLTVATVRYESAGIALTGAASGGLSNWRPDQAGLRAKLQSNPHFRLPRDPHRDVIFIAAGTGIAPFRGFLQQRRAQVATGRNWLLFGEQSRARSFLYQSEWLDALKRGYLHRLDVAFSRDQAEKIYVQHKLAEHAEALVGWLDSGAHLYLCGDARRLAPAVDAALVAAYASVRGFAIEAAETALAQLRADGRYQRDVY